MFGERPPLFFAFGGPALSCFELELDYPPLAAQYEVIARERTVVRFDWRNTGQSSRGVSDVEPAAFVGDLLALQDELGFEQIAMKMHGGTRLAFRYAATYPDRVSSLALSAPSITAADPDQPPSVSQQLMKIAAGADWQLFCRLAAVNAAGWEGPDSEFFAKYFQASTHRADFFATMAATSGDDVTDLLNSVTCPVLLMMRREPANFFFEQLDPERHLVDAQELADLLPSGRVEVLEGSSMMISSDPAATAALLGFLRSTGPA